MKSSLLVVFTFQLDRDEQTQDLPVHSQPIRNGELAEEIDLGQVDDFG